MNDLQRPYMPRLCLTYRTLLALPPFAPVPHCRLIRLSDAFSAYTTDGLAAAPAPTPAPATTTAALAAPTSTPSTTVLSPAAKDALLAVFSKRGSYVQELLVEELVAAADALSREALSETLRLVLGSAPVAVALSSMEAAGPLRPLLLPLTGPLELMSRLAPAVALTPEDEEALGVVRGIFQLVQRLQPAEAAAAVSNGGSNGGYSSSSGGMVFSTTARGGSRGLGGPFSLPGSSNGNSGTAAGGGLDARSAAAAAVEALSEAAAVAGELRPLLPELLPGLTHTGELFVRAFVRRVVQRATESLSLAAGPTAEQQEEAMAMAALGFMPTAASAAAAAAGASAGGAGGNRAGASSLFAPTTTVALGASGQLSRSPSTFSMWSSTANSNNGFGSSSGVDVFSAFSRAMWGRAPTTVGELVTGLAAAPLLAVLTPLAVMSEMQRRQQQQQQQGEGQGRDDGVSG